MHPTGSGSFPHSLRQIRELIAAPARAPVIPLSEAVAAQALVSISRTLERTRASQPTFPPAQLQLLQQVPAHPMPFPQGPVLPFAPPLPPYPSMQVQAPAFVRYSRPPGTPAHHLSQFMPPMLQAPPLPLGIPSAPLPHPPQAPSAIPAPSPMPLPQLYKACEKMIREIIEIGVKSFSLPPAMSNLIFKAAFRKNCKNLTPVQNYICRVALHLTFVLYSKQPGFPGKMVVSPKMGISLNKLFSCPRLIKNFIEHNPMLRVQIEQFQTNIKNSTWFTHGGYQISDKLNVCIFSLPAVSEDVSAAAATAAAAAEAAAPAPQPNANKRPHDEISPDDESPESQSKKSRTVNALNGVQDPDSDPCLRLIHTIIDIGVTAFQLDRKNTKLIYKEIFVRSSKELTPKQSYIKNAAIYLGIMTQSKSDEDGLLKIADRTSIGKSKFENTKRNLRRLKMHSGVQSHLRDFERAIREDVGFMTVLCQDPRISTNLFSAAAAAVGTP